MHFKWGNYMICEFYLMKDIKHTHILEFQEKSFDHQVMKAFICRGSIEKAKNP